MRPATTIALGILLLLLFGAFIVQFVFLKPAPSTDVPTTRPAIVSVYRQLN